MLLHDEVERTSPIQVSREPEALGNISPSLPDDTTDGRRRPNSSLGHCLYYTLINVCDTDLYTKEKDEHGAYSPCSSYQRIIPSWNKASPEVGE